MPCPECGAEVSDQASACPRCGRPLTRAPAPAAPRRPAPKAGLGTGAIIAIVVGAVAAAVIVIVVVLSSKTVTAAEEADVNATRLLLDKVGAQAEMMYARSSPRAYPASLRALVEKDYVTEDQLRDPWGNALEYAVEGRSYEICSSGPDGRRGGGDDICKKGGR